MADDNMDSDVSQSSHSGHSIVSQVSQVSHTSSLYLEMVPFNLRGRAEWWELRREEIKINERLAEGSNGIINKVKWRGTECVVKYLKHNNNETEYEDLINEISVISHLRHPRLVLFLGACTLNEPLMLLYEYMPNGSLDSYYSKMSHKYSKQWKPSPKYMYKWIKELTQAIYFLHNCYYPIMHRDIKPSNILLDEDLHIKLTDFGLSRTIKKKHDIYKMSGCTGTLRYMAPEILFNNGEDYNLMIDIYSLALNYWFISAGTRPFNEIDKNPQIIHLIKEGFRPNINDIHNNAELKKLIMRMWNTCPEMRPDIKEVLDEINLITEKIEKTEKLDKEDKNNKQSALGAVGKKCAIM
jgi:serine/threonine protein kinase